METTDDIRASSIARALIVKRNNAITAIAAGGALAVIAAKLCRAGGWWLGLSLSAGVLTGVLYANGFEYVLHRSLLHWGTGFLVRQHALHHNSAGTPDEARYVNFATSPWVVVLVFVLNAPAALLAGYLLGAGIGAGMLIGFTVYYVLYEEVHWRIHFGGWLPRWLRFARRHHMLHHAGFDGRYNVFLPFFDWIFERRHWKGNPARSH